MVDFSSETQRSIVDDSMTLVAHMLPEPIGLLLQVTIVTKSTVLVANKARICQRNIALLTRKAVRMPIGRHSLDHPTDDKVVALVAARCKQDMEVFFAVLATFKFVENAILELAEALSAHKALGVPKLAVRIDDSLMRFKALVTSGTDHCTERHVRGNCMPIGFTVLSR